jgi:hypothetical protein
MLSCDWLRMLSCDWLRMPSAQGRVMEGTGDEVAG